MFRISSSLLFVLFALIVSSVNGQDFSTAPIPVPVNISDKYVAETFGSCAACSVTESYARGPVRGYVAWRRDGNGWHPIQNMGGRIQSRRQNRGGGIPIIRRFRGLFRGC